MYCIIWINALFNIWNGVGGGVGARKVLIYILDGREEEGSENWFLCWWLMESNNYVSYFCVSPTGRPFHQWCVVNFSSFQKKQIILCGFGGLISCGVRETGGLDMCPLSLVELTARWRTASLPLPDCLSERGDLPQALPSRPQPWTLQDPVHQVQEGLLHTTRVFGWSLQEYHVVPGRQGEPKGLQTRERWSQK